MAAVLGFSRTVVFEIGKIAAAIFPIAIDALDSQWSCNPRDDADQILV